MTTPQLAHILVVDDDAATGRMLDRILSSAGYRVTVAETVQQARDALRRDELHAVLSDMAMPTGSGLDVLAAAHSHDPNLPVVFLTGHGDVDGAQRALERGALRYLTKPITARHVLAAVEEACRAQAATSGSRPIGDGSRPVAHTRSADPDLRRVALKRELDVALEHLWMALQPVISVSHRRVVAYEALLRSDAPTMATPDRIIAAAEELGRLPELGRRIRAAVAARVDELPADIDMLMNLHPLDLGDDELFDPDAPLSRVAARVILELTERASLDSLEDLDARIARLRSFGFRVAIDDLGAGYGSLSAIALVRPDLVKLDMSLVRNVHTDPVRMHMVRAIGHMCERLHIDWLCEGVETAEELAALSRAGVDFVQGYLLGRPGRALGGARLEALAAEPRRPSRLRFSQGVSLIHAARALCQEAIAVHDTMGEATGRPGPGAHDELTTILGSLLELVDVLAGGRAGSAGQADDGGLARGTLRA